MLHTNPKLDTNPTRKRGSGGIDVVLQFPSLARRVGVAAPVVLMLALLAGCGPTAEKEPKVEPPQVAAVMPSATAEEVKTFCGACHPTPLPESFPRDRWMHEVERGYEFYLLSDRTDLRLPRQSGVVKYYQDLAPERLELPPPPAQESQPRFQRAEFTWPEELQAQGSQAVAHILDLKHSDQGTSLTLCDMRSGTVDWLTIADKEIRLTHREQLKNPCHLFPTDLDGDGETDYLVADLGSFLPEDHTRGRLVWLAPRAEGGFKQHVLLDGVGRVADATAADFDGDGDLDIVVGVFGWNASGNVLLLRQTGQSNGIPQFETEVLDSRHGAIHTCVTDLNADGRLDIVALISQEHEVVECFLNQPNGTFQKQTAYQAPDPSYGSSGIQLVDFDGDGDQDVLYTNGDTFDSYYVKPYHSIRWIENLGDGRWKDHLLLNLPGVHRALAADLDGDGDLDIAASCFIPTSAREKQPDVASFASLVWIERRGTEFIPHTIEREHCVHAAMELADVNGDGALDIIAGSFDSTGGSQALRPFDVWLNRGPPGGDR